MHRDGWIRLLLQIGHFNHVLRHQQRGDESPEFLIEIIPSRKSANRNPEDSDHDKDYRHLVYVHWRAQQGGWGSHKQEHAQEYGEAAPNLGPSAQAALGYFQAL